MYVLNSFTGSSVNAYKSLGDYVACKEVTQSIFDAKYMHLEFNVMKNIFC